MRERKILFSTELVPGVHAGRKTKTRRILRHDSPTTVTDPKWERCDECLWTGVDDAGTTIFARAPADAGDRLWVQEAHHIVDHDPESRSVIVEYASDETRRHVYLTEAENEKLAARSSPLTKPMPGRFMYRSLSRATLEVLSVRVERVQEISEADAMAEGIPAPVKVASSVPFQGVQYKFIAPGVLHTNVYGDHDRDAPAHDSAREAFAVLWDSINGERASWASNPWVWCIDFRRIVEQAKAVAS